ncbi:MAG: hypothetical protein ACQKBV_09560 [Puniceicoccales bacterium]
MISSYLDMQRRAGPVSFLVSLLLTGAGSVILIELVDAWLRSNHHLSGLIVFIAIVIAAFGGSILMMQMIRRLRDMNWHGMYAMLVVFPVIAIAVVAGLDSALSPVGKGIFVVLGLAVVAPLILVPSQRADATVEL